MEERKLFWCRCCKKKMSNLKYKNDILKLSLPALQYAYSVIKFTEMESNYRIVSGIRKYEHIRPALCSLHWLPVEYRIQFKIAVTTFSIRRSGEPAYLASLLHDKVSVRSLRSSDKSFLDVPRRQTETAKRSFRFAAPTIWNSLPVQLRQLDPITVSRRSFKKQLKTIFSTMPTHSELVPFRANESARTTYGVL